MSAKKKIKFRFSAPSAQKVSLAGSFNNWDTNICLMKKDKKGIWTTTLSLEPGRYEYKFVVDGNWYNDPEAKETVLNEWGSENSVIVIS